MKLGKKSMRIAGPVILVFGALFTLSSLKFQEKLSDIETKQIQSFRTNSVVLARNQQKPPSTVTASIETPGQGAAENKVTQQRIDNPTKAVSISTISTPNPVVNPKPQPTPSPVVTPQPQPTPSPIVTPQPEPTPSPVVTPQPEPTPSPVETPQPEPTPSPVETPQPSPQPEPQPVENPSSNQTGTTDPAMSP